jgi:hypothetical protein
MGIAGGKEKIDLQGLGLYGGATVNANTLTDALLGRPKKSLNGVTPTEEVLIREDSQPHSSVEDTYINK